MLSKRQFFLIACLFFGTVIGAVALLMDRLQRQAYEAEARNPAEWGSSVGDTAGALIISVPTKDLRAQDASVRYAILCVFGVLTASLVGISCFLFSRVHQRTCQLIASEKKLRKREARWRMVLNSAQDPMITTDRQGIVQTASDSTDAVLGWKPHELVGENISVLMPEPYRSEHDEYLARYQRAGVSHLLGQPRELPVLRRDGTVIPCLLTLWQVDVPDGSEPLFSGIIRDITEQKRAEEASSEQMQLLSLNADIATALTRGGTLREVLQRSAELIVQHLDAAFARIWTYNKDNRMLELQASAGLYTHIDGTHSRIPLGAFKIGLIASEQRPHLTNDVQNDPRVSDPEWAQREGMVAFAGYPLTIEGELAGVMAVFSRRPLTESAIDVLATIANALTVGIDHLRVEQSLTQFRTALDCSPDAVFLIDRKKMRFVDMNETACASTGYSRDELLAMGPHDIKPQVTKGELVQQLDAILESQQQVGVIETVHRRKDGLTFPVEVFLRPLKSDDNTTLIASARDITERKRWMEQLRELAFHDTLTGLPNRASILRSIQDSIDRGEDNFFALLFLDFDRFKLINDSLGHEFGDELLKEIAHRLRGGLRDTDRIQSARLGGDEFVLLLEGLTSPGDAIAVAERLLQVLSQAYQLGDHTVYSTASIGVVTSEHRYESASDMLRDADLSMYAAKAAGKGCYAFFDQSLREKVQARLSIEGELREAISRDEFVLAYQPIVSLETGQVEGVEALIRWMHPRRGLLGTAEFVSVAEETGLIVPIGEWVLDEACRQLAQWQRSLGSAIPLSVHINVSRKQLLLPNLVRIVEQALVKHAVPAERLHLEVTESEIMQDPGAARVTLGELRRLGVKIDIDDFGTGYSSFSCLHEFPIDVLKIDRSFVANLRRGRDFAALLHAIVTLADNLGLQVVAEGIEDAEQLALLQALSCGYGQGYFFSKPMSADEVEDFVRSKIELTLGEFEVRSMAVPVSIPDDETNQFYQYGGEA